jgi:hypothetical protein
MATERNILIGDDWCRSTTSGDLAINLREYKASVAKKVLLPDRKFRKFQIRHRQYFAILPDYCTSFQPAAVSAFMCDKYIISHCGLLGYGTVQSGRLLSTSRGNILPPSSTLKMGADVPSQYWKPRARLHGIITQKTTI